MSTCNQVEVIVEEGVTFDRATPGSAARDLHAASVTEPLAIQPNEVRLIGTGVRLNMGDPNCAAVILPRSGTGHKRGLVLGNLVGLIDSDYQGEIFISLWNRTDSCQIVEPMERIAQLMFIPIIHPTVDVVTEFTTSTARGTGGFGSTGT